MAHLMQVQCLTGQGIAISPLHTPCHDVGQTKSAVAGPGGSGLSWYNNTERY